MSLIYDRGWNRFIKSGANAHKSFVGINPMKSQNSEIALVTAVDVAGQDELKTQPPGEYTAAFG